ncbi:MAG: metallophosphoesterase [Lachnospiraceae bacterium]|nr:metallophosphoesterase [Lachnospiraceae bacterium]
MKERLWGVAYIADEESEKIRPLLCAAVEYHRRQEAFLIPHSYWTDKKGQLYLRWNLQGNPQGQEERPVWRYWFDEAGELQAEEIPRKLSRTELLRGVGSSAPVVLITGDTHRNFTRIIQFCNRFHTTKEDVLVILGDAGINFLGGDKDIRVKERLAQLPITLFCIHGNHEKRPESVGTYRMVDWHGGAVYVEDAFPNLLFAKDGEIYDIAGKKTIVIGGAYSVDKWYRLERQMSWFADEQPSAKIKAYVEEQLQKKGWRVDVVLSHTTPYQYRPMDRFMPEIDQGSVDTSTEEWLTRIENRLSYEKWYAGHYHCDRRVDKLQIMYRKVELFGKDTELGFEMT